MSEVAGFAAKEVEMPTAPKIDATPVAPTAAAGLWDDYRPLPSVFDERLAASGELRPHWRLVSDALAGLGRGELQRRAGEARRLLAESGATHNVFAHPQGKERPWPFDPVPLPIAQAEWDGLASALEQRATLLHFLLADLYGSCETIHRGLIPPELVFSHPGYLRPCRHMFGGAIGRLHLYSADVARVANGSFMVVADRTQAPTGLGFALENRIILSRVLPDLYRDAHVRRVAGFFRTLRSALNALAPVEQDNPRVVLLTPGPGADTFFEHAYLANYLGYSLVEGGDLAVRDGRVWLKTLDGLQPVHVILRRVDDAFCDPLELRTDSKLGVPGLLQAVRAGNVAVANPMGVSILEHPALRLYLPRLCRSLLGEDLRLPSAPVWWGGDEQHLQHILANLDRLALAGVWSQSSTTAVLGEDLSLRQQDQWRERIRAQPHAFFAYESLNVSTTPALCSEGVEPRAMVLKTYLVGREYSYAVLPGGLARTAGPSPTWNAPFGHGGVSKDVWILCPGPEAVVTLLPPEGAPLVLSRGGGEVASRVAENLFWFGRYTERLDGQSRLLRQTLLRWLDPDPEPDPGLMPVLLGTIAFLTGGKELGPAPLDLAGIHHELMSAAGDLDRSESIRHTLSAVAGAARSIRDRLSDDTCRVLTSLDSALGKPRALGELLERVEHLIVLSSAIAGLGAESMTRGQGWRFLELGRRLERGIHTCELLQAFCVPAHEPESPLLEALLNITDSIMTYRRRYRARLQAGAVLDLLLHDGGNPRSVEFQLARLQEQVRLLPGPPPSGARRPEERVLLEAVRVLRLTDLEGLAAPTPNHIGERTELASLLKQVTALLRMLSETIGRTYFEHVDAPHQLVDFS